MEVKLIASKFQRFINILKEGNRNHNDDEIIRESIKSIPCFQRYQIESDCSVFDLFDMLKYEKIDAHQFLFRKGDKGTKFYIVLSGNPIVMVPNIEKTELNINEAKNIKKLCGEMPEINFISQRRSLMSQFSRGSNSNKKDNNVGKKSDLNQFNKLLTGSDNQNIINEEFLGDFDKCKKNLILIFLKKFFFL